MTTYKIFKKHNSKLKKLTPMSESNKLICCKLIDVDNPVIRYNDDAEMYLEMDQCPRIYIGMVMNCKNIETNQYEVIGKLVDIQYDETSGYLFVFEECGEETV